MKIRQVRKVLVPVDGSDCSRAALEFAVTLATTLGASIEVLTVVEDNKTNGGPTREEMDRVVRSVSHDGVALEQHVDSGDPRERIVSRAERDDFDLIVLGTHGRTGRPRSLAGSVAESVVRTAPCPVLTVRG